MKKKLAWIGLWLALFTGTIAARSAFNGADATSIQPFRDTINTLAVIQLHAQTRDWHPFDKAESQDDPDMHDAVVQNKAMFVRCRSMFASRSRRPKEFFEFSFVKSGSSRSDGGPRVDLQDVRLERATLTLEPAEQDCLVNAMASIQIKTAITAAANARSFFEMCISMP